ncbi:MAG: hypothetical protein R2774_11575 [Saprospiraceae bacterium]
MWFKRFLLIVFVSVSLFAPFSDESYHKKPTFSDDSMYQDSTYQYVHKGT